jgi:PD-(D/E)XK nuclease superfamily
VHPLFEKASGLTEKIIAAAIEVHRDKGPGLIEFIYEWCLLKELGLRSLEYVSQKFVPIEYKGFTRENPDDPQGPTLELYEVAEYSCWIAHQFPRAESY